MGVLLNLREPGLYYWRVQTNVEKKLWNWLGIFHIKMNFNMISLKGQNSETLHRIGHWCMYGGANFLSSSTFFFSLFFSGIDNSDIFNINLAFWEHAKWVPFWFLYFFCTIILNLPLFSHKHKKEMNLNFR